jgi:hypothetical protein
LLLIAQGNVVAEKAKEKAKKDPFERILAVIVTPGILRREGG